MSDINIPPLSKRPNDVPVPPAPDVATPAGKFSRKQTEDTRSHTVYDVFRDGKKIGTDTMDKDPL